MLKVINRKSTPNPPFRYYQPETNTWLESIDFTALMDKVMWHRQKHGLPLPVGWESEIEVWMCNNLGWRGVCHEVSETKERKLSNSDVKNFLKSVATVIDTEAKGEDAFVDKEEATRRGGICAQCPQNQRTINFCSVCPGGIIRAVVKFRDYFKGKKTDLTTEHDEQLFACHVCGCENRTQIHILKSILDKVKGDYQYPDHCWKK